LLNKFYAPTGAASIEAAYSFRLTSSALLKGTGFDFTAFAKNSPFFATRTTIPRTPYSVATSKQSVGKMASQINIILPAAR